MSEVSPLAPPPSAGPPDNRPVVILVMGIVGLTMCQVFGGVAWFLGNQYERECRATGVKPDQMAVIGKILGMVGVGLFAALLLVWGLMMLAYVAMLLLWFVMMMLFMAIGVLGAAAGA